MPRKSLDIRSADHPPAWERGSCAFPCFRRGRVRAEPGRRVKGRVPCGFSGQRPEPSESLPVSISTDFQGSIEPVFLTPLFHSLFDTTTAASFQRILFRRRCLMVRKSAVSIVSSNLHFRHFTRMTFFNSSPPHYLVPCASCDLMIANICSGFKRRFSI